MSCSGSSASDCDAGADCCDEDDTDTDCSGRIAFGGSCGSEGDCSCGDGCGGQGDCGGDCVDRRESVCGADGNDGSRSEESLIGVSSLTLAESGMRGRCRNPSLGWP